jgi:parvulin-like peptidyl-prolyl isomerase
MDVRLALSSLLLVAASVTAQVNPDKVVPAPAGTPAGTPAAQDPDKPAPRPVDVIGELQREKERLQSEIEYARNRVQNAKVALSSKLGQRGQTFKAIDAGTNAPAPAPVAQMRKARVMQPAELEAQPQDVLALVNGEPIRAGEFQELMEYLRSSPNSGDDSQRAQRIWFELVRTQSVVGAFPENDASARMADIYAEFDAGKTVADVAKVVGSVQGAGPDGSVEITRNSFLGTKFEQVAFTLRPGQRSRPFPTPQGIAIVEVKSFEKGDSPEFDKVKAHVAQVAWQADPAMLQRAQSAATTGQVDIVVRSETELAQLPPLWRPTPTAPPANSLDNEVAQLMDTLRQIDAMIAKLSTSGEDAAKQQLEQLRQQRPLVEKAIEELRRKAQTDADREEGAVVEGQTEANVPPKAPQQPLPKKQ